MMTESRLEDIRKQLDGAEALLQSILDPPKTPGTPDPDFSGLRARLALRAIQAARAELPAQEQAEYSS
jgi:hypothetical protein